MSLEENMDVVKVQKRKGGSFMITIPDHIVTMLKIADKEHNLLVKFLYVFPDKERHQVVYQVASFK